LTDTVKNRKQWKTKGKNNYKCILSKHDIKIARSELLEIWAVEIYVTWELLPGTPRRY
jgi:hypothetical protein